MKKATFFQLLGGALITAGGLYIFLKDIQPAELWREISSTPVLILVGVALLNPLSLWFRSMRWKIILTSGKKSSVKELFPLVTIGFMVNNILPARLGEAVRALLLWKKNGYTAAESIGSLLVERFLDILVFSTFFFIPVFFSGKLASLYLYGYLLAVIFFGACIVAFLYTKFPVVTSLVSSKIVSFFPQKIQKFILKISTELVSNITWVFSIKKVIAVFILSFLTVFCYAGMMLLLGKGIDNFGLLDGMFGVAFAALGAAIPLAPGYVGTLHVMLQRGLSLVGVTPDKAGAIVILYHAIGYITVTIIGLYYFFSIKLSFRDLGKVKQNFSKEE